MESILKISIGAAEPTRIDGVFNLMEKVKLDHPDLFQRVEVVMEC